MKIKEIISYIESFAPLAFQEEYDNAGLIIGDEKANVNSALLCFDVTLDVLEEAIKKKCNLIISHHPIIFIGIKKITGNNYIDQIIVKAIKNDIAIYAVHTNLDNIKSGINNMFCQKLGLTNCRILKPKRNLLQKLVTFCPDIKLPNGRYAPGAIRNALFAAGAGFIGNYDKCSHNIEGRGTFRGLEGTDPFIGKQGRTQVQKEVRIETIFPKYLQSKVISALLEAHPYEEVAYDIYPLDNPHNEVGAGMIGELEKEVKDIKFLQLVKKTLNCENIRHSNLLNKNIKKVAVCGGAGSYLLNDAISNKADIFISADFKYHEFFRADNKIIIADIGHYESEQFSIEILHDILTKKYTTFAFRKTSLKTNPIKYL